MLNYSALKKLKCIFVDKLQTRTNLNCFEFFYEMKKKNNLSYFLHSDTCENFFDIN